MDEWEDIFRQLPAETSEELGYHLKYVSHTSMGSRDPAHMHTRRHLLAKVPFAEVPSPQS
jgi:hypothetical protein